MYSTDNQRLPKKLVIGSLARAEAELEHWIRENRYDQLDDADGLSWQLAILTNERAAAANPRELEIELRFALSALVAPEILLQSRILDRALDARLLAMLEDTPIPMSIRPLVLMARGVEEARRMICDELPRHRAKLMDPKIREMKRHLVGKWVENITIFGKLDPHP